MAEVRVERRKEALNRAKPQALTYHQPFQLIDHLIPLKTGDSQISVTISERAPTDMMAVFPGAILVIHESLDSSQKSHEGLLLLLLPFLRWGNRGLERLANMPKVTQPTRSGFPSMQSYLKAHILMHNDTPAAHKCCTDASCMPGGKHKCRFILGKTKRVKQV